MSALKIRGVWESTSRQVRVEFGGETIADSQNVMLMIESEYEIHYYFPQEDVRMELLVDAGHSEKSGLKGTATFWNVKVGDKVAENAAWTYANLKDNRPDMRGYIAFDWHKMDAWYEEAEEVFVHARNPYHRVDTIQSSRHIRVEVDGKTVAESSRPVLLFETSLPTRYYLPPEDVQSDLLTPTETHTACPYKGVASYWSVQVNGQSHEDIVWGYPDPIAEVPKIKGLLAFYNEKVDIYVDGQLEEKPKTVWS